MWSAGCNGGTADETRPSPFGAGAFFCARFCVPAASQMPALHASWRTCRTKNRRYRACRNLSQLRHETPTIAPSCSWVMVRNPRIDAILLPRLIAFLPFANNLCRLNYYQFTLAKFFDMNTIRRGTKTSGERRSIGVQAKSQALRRRWRASRHAVQESALPHERTSPMTRGPNRVRRDGGCAPGGRKTCATSITARAVYPTASGDTTVNKLKL